MADRMEVEAKVVVTGNTKNKNNSNGINKDAIKNSKAIADNVKNASNSAEKLSNSIKNAFNKSAIIGWAKIIKDTINGMIKASEKQAEYIENLNMMQVAFGKSADAASNYIDTLVNATGFDANNLTRQLGIFRQISSAMGYTSEVADLLSTNLSKLSLDISSLYNTSVERAGKSLESAITGQVRSIRSLTGADITLATLQQEAYRLGIEKTTSEMTRAEKTILIYLSLERQLANANGDVARTINSVANQTKIFKDQIVTLGRNIGGFLIPILKTLLPILNGILMVINTIAEAILGLFGIDAYSLSKEFGIASDGFEGLEEDLLGVENASQKAKKSLRGFDKLNNITTPSASGSSGVAGGGIGSVDSKLLDALKEYNLHLDEMKNKATEIRDKIMKWLGFTKTINKETGKITWKYIGLEKHLGTFGIFLKDFGSKSKSFFEKLGEDIYKVFSPNWDKILNNFASGFSNIGKLWNKVLADLDYGINTFSDEIITMISSVFTDVLQSYILPFTELVTIIWKDFTEIIYNIWDEHGKSIISKVGEFVTNIVKLFKKLWTDILEPILKPFIKTLQELWDNTLKDMLTQVLEFVAKLIEITLDIYNHVIKPIISFIIDFIKPCVVYIGNFVIGVFRTTVEGFSNAVKTITAIFSDIIDFIKGVFTGNWEKAWQGVSNIFKDIANGLVNIFIHPLNFIIDSINAFISGLNKLKIPDWVPKVGGKGFNIKQLSRIEYKEDGGFVKSGDIFVANENNKPEYLGSFGHQTAVANTDQIVDGIAIGVTKAMIATGGRDNKVVIEAKGDASGLLDFITFEQKKKDRQYGL